MFVFLHQKTFLNLIKDIKGSQGQLQDMDTTLPQKITQIKAVLIIIFPMIHHLFIHIKNTFTKLEIKPCGLESRIRGMEAESCN